MALTYGNVPMFGHLDRQSVTASKPAGAGWDNLGQRTVRGVVLHRMLGTLRGTDQYFRGSTPALTDYGLGVREVDGDLAGVIYQWNDPYGHRSGWASGPVSAPYGDGAAFVTKYGVNAVNRDLVSIEISGYQTTPIDDFAWRELVHFVACWADQCKVPWATFPHNPATGFSFLIWHQEFTIGTGKECPFQWVMQNTDRLIADVAAFLKPYQTGGATEPAPIPQPTKEDRPPFEVRFEVPIRKAPGFTGKVITTLKPGTKGRIKDGPKRVDNLDWYDVEIDGFGTGWVQMTVLKTLAIA